MSHKRADRSDKFYVRINTHKIVKFIGRVMTHPINFMCVMWRINAHKPKQLTTRSLISEVSPQTTPSYLIIPLAAAPHLIFCGGIHLVNIAVGFSSPHDRSFFRAEGRFSTFLCCSITDVVIFWTLSFSRASLTPKLKSPQASAYFITTTSRAAVALQEHL